MLSTKIKSPAAALVFIGAALFFYILLRAFLVSFTHDEGLTVMEYATQSWPTINNLNWTNNHLLNTWLCRLNLDWFGASEISFRWPNVLAGLLYIVFGARLLKKITGNTWTTVAAFLVLICNTFLVDFFGLCRGYGLSMGLLMTGLYYFFRYLETNRLLQYGGPALMLFGFALIANYTLLNFFLLFSGFLMLHSLVYLLREKASWKIKVMRLVIYLFTGIVLFFFIQWFVRMMLKMREVGNFNFGGEEGFWKNTVPSLIDCSSGPLVHPWPFLQVILTWLIAGLFIGAGCILFQRLRKHKWSAFNWFTVFLFLSTAGCAVAIWLQHQLMNVPFSSDRAGLYFYLLFPLLIIACFFTPGSAGRLRKTAAGVVLILPVISFFISLNLDRTLLWPFNAHMKEAVQKIIDDSKTRFAPTEKVQVAIAFLQYPVYNYYVYAAKASSLNFFVYTEPGYNPNADYYLKLDEYDEAPSPEFKVIWEKNGQKLFRREPFLKTTELKTIGQSGYETEGPQAHAPGYTGRFSQLLNAQCVYGAGHSDTLRDTLRAGTIIQYHAFVYPENIRTSAKWIVKAERGTEMVIGYGTYISWRLKEEKQWNEVWFNYILQADLFPGDRVFLFFMCPDKENVYVDDTSAGYFIRSSN
jgi:hypothetical protein